MTIDVQLTWPGLSEALKEHDCRECRPPRKCEKYLDKWGVICISEYDWTSRARPILVERWRFPADKLPGVVRIEHSDCWHHPQAYLSPRTERDFLCLSETLCRALGIEPPTLCEGETHSVWLNPSHPANKE